MEEDGWGKEGEREGRREEDDWRREGERDGRMNSEEGGEDEQ